MNRYLVFFEQYDRYGSGQRVDMFCADNIVDLCNECEWFDNLMIDIKEDADYKNTAITDDMIIEWIDNIDIGGWDGFAIYRIGQDRLIEIANSGIMELG